MENPGFFSRKHRWTSRLEV